MLAAACCLLALVPPHEPIHVGFSANASDLLRWTPIQMENKPDVYRDRTGALWMRLPHVPDGWPYEFQWSGITTDAVIDLDKYPIVVAAVSRMLGKSYAHMDFQEFNSSGKPSWTELSTTLTQVGLSIGDIGKNHHGVRRLHLRLIVGGSNEGAAAGYAYVRFIRREDLDFVTKHPNWDDVDWVR